MLELGLHRYVSHHIPRPRNNMNVEPGWSLLLILAFGFLFHWSGLSSRVCVLSIKSQHALPDYQKQKSYPITHNTTCNRTHLRFCPIVWALKLYNFETINQRLESSHGLYLLHIFRLQTNLSIPKAPWLECPKWALQEGHFFDMGMA